jgi:predicted nucleic acid-binding protein
MKIFLDLNVVLDLLLDRAPWVDEAKRMTARVLSGDLQAYVSATSVPTLFYIASRTAGAERARIASNGA